MKEIFIDEENEGQRLDKLLFRYLNKAPKSFVFKMLRKKNIKLNKKAASPETKVKKGDIVTLFLADETIAAFREKKSPPKVSADVDIIYEDKDIIIADKPVGLLSQADRPGGDCLNLRLISYMDKKGELRDDFVPSVCNRLDRNTSGLVTAAKNAPALREINEAVRNGTIHKIYHCVTVSPPPKNSDIISAYHKKDDTRNIVRISDTPSKDFREIKTGYKILSQKSGLSLVEVKLFTGKKHQIRAHLAHIGANILGDGKYGNINANKRYGVFRQALCAYSLQFDLPENSPFSYLNKIEVHAPKPDFEKFFD